jgi:hypothetical protein
MSSAENGITGIDDSFIDVCSFSEEQQGDSLAVNLGIFLSGDVSGEDVIEYENLRFRSR